jgi:hypothetical protein
MCRSNLGLASVKDKYNLDMKILFRLAGAGYRVMAKFGTQRSRKWERLWVYATRPTRHSSLPLEIWLGQGCPLNPYLKGKIVDLARDQYIPKDSKCPPDILVYDEDHIILEGGLYQEWLRLYFKWLSWYCRVLLDPNPSLQDVFDPPVVERSWKGRSEISFEIERFGFLWKIYDLVRQNPAWVPPVLGPGRDLACSNSCLNDDGSVG